MKNKIKFKYFVAFIIFEFVFTALTSPIVLFYGPFEKARSIFVGTAMTSMNYQWLATSFLSQEKINKILGKEDSKEELIRRNVGEEETKSVQVSAQSNNNVQYLLLDKNENFIGHVLVVSDALRVKIGYSSKIKDPIPVGEETSQIAKNNDAIAAVNGGAFKDAEGEEQWTSNGGLPTGVIMTDGNVIFDDTNGSRAGMIAITKEGKLIAGQYTLDELKSIGVSEAVSFDTTILVSGGEMTDMSGDGGGGTAPRTLIGQKKDGAIVLVVLDSIEKGSRSAATLKEAQEVMYKLGCYTAATLDGGKSSTMYYDNKVVNSPSYAYGERNIASAIIVKK